MHRHKAVDVSTNTAAAQQATLLLCLCCCASPIYLIVILPHAVEWSEHAKQRLPLLRHGVLRAEVLIQVSLDGVALRS